MHWHPRRLEETDCVEEGREDDSHNEMLVVVVLGIHRALFLVGGSRSSSASSGEGGFGAVNFFYVARRVCLGWRFGLQGSVQ